MAYEKKTWKNRQSEYPNRRTLTPVDGQENTYDVARAEGLVMEEGDAFDQKTMQDLEDRVAAGFAAVTSRTYTAQDLEDRVAAGFAAVTSRTYTAILPTEGWTGDGETGYTQTVDCEGMTADVVTLQPMILPTGVRETDIAAREALGYISMVETLEGQVTVTCWEDKPTVNLTIYLVEAR